MALPTSRDETCTAATPVHSNLINKIQDQIVGAKYPLLTMAIPVACGRPVAGTTTADGTGVGGEASAASIQFTMGIPLDVGTRIVAVRGRVQDSATGPTRVRMTLYSLVDGVKTSIGTQTTSGTAGTEQTLTVAVPTVVAAGTTYLAYFDTPSGAGIVRVHGLEVDHDRL